MRCLCEAFIGESDMSKGGVLRIQPLFMKKNFYFSNADSQVFTGIGENIFKKKCCKSLEYEKKSLPLHPQNERGSAV